MSRQVVVNADALDVADTLISDTDDPLVIIDPPWDAGLFWVGSRSSNRLVMFDGFRAGDAINENGPPTWLFTWDCVSSWYTPNRPLRRAKYCAWYGDVANYNPEGYLYGDPCGKPRMVTNTRGQYLFEPSSGKHLSDVFSSPITKLRKTDRFNHSKPLDWVAMMIANCGGGRPVIDLFAGSGVFGVACKILDIDYVGVEICPSAAKNAQSAIDGYRKIPKMDYQEDLWQ